MFSKRKVEKENNITYFFGGTAVGMAAGLLFGKLISNATRTSNSEFRNLSSKSRSKYSQDDNIHSLKVKKNMHDCQSRSRSAGRYKECDNRLEKGQCFKKFDKELLDNLNNLDINNKCDKNMQKNVYYNKEESGNISIEDNSKCNVDIKILSEHSKKKGKNSFDHFNENEKATEGENSVKNGKYKSSTETINVESLNKTKNEKAGQKHVKVESTIEMDDTIKSLPIEFHENTTIYTNFKDKSDSVKDWNILQCSVDNLSMIATYDESRIYANDNNDQTNFTSIDEFYESDVISSTKQDNLEEI